MFEITPDAVGAPAPAATLEAAIAAELVAAAQLLNALADELGRDEEVLRRHGTAFQTIDRVTQVQLALAEFLRGDEPVESRLARIPLAEMAARLKATRPGNP